MNNDSDFLLMGILLALGLLAGRVASHTGLPRVAAYLLVGVLFSRDLLGDLLGFHIGAWSEIFTHGALGVIAYLIGGSITIGHLKRIGGVITGAIVGETVGVVLVVFGVFSGVLVFLGNANAVSIALTFSVLALSTAPAATLALIHQYRSKGPLTDTMLGVVALDDAVGMMGYSLLLILLTDNSFGSSIALTLFEIGGAILLGAAVGWLLSKSSVWFGASVFRLPIILASILIVLGCAESLHLSQLLASLVLGFAARYFSQASAGRLFSPIHPLEETIYLLFFTIAGAHFDLSLFLNYFPFILLYFTTRIVGKVLGASTGASLVGAPPQVTRWIGLGLLPQAGVAIGLALTFSHEAAFEGIGSMVLNVIIGATLLNELTGPIAAKYALQRADEIHLKRERHRHEGF